MATDSQKLTCWKYDDEGKYVGESWIAILCNHIEDDDGEKGEDLLNRFFNRAMKKNHKNEKKRSPGKLPFGNSACHLASLRVRASSAVLRDFIHDQGFVEKDPNIFRDFEPSGMEEFSSAMRFSANISEN